MFPYQLCLAESAMLLNQPREVTLVQSIGLINYVYKSRPEVWSIKPLIGAEHVVALLLQRVFRASTTLSGYLSHLSALVKYDHYLEESTKGV